MQPWCPLFRSSDENPNALGRDEKKHEHEEERENYRMMERRYGSFQRSLRLPDTVDEDKTHAVDVSASCARPFKASVLMKSVSRATKASSIFRLNGGCANCSRLRTNTLH